MKHRGNLLDFHIEAHFLFIFLGISMGQNGGLTDNSKLSKKVPQTWGTILQHCSLILWKYKDIENRFPSEKNSVPKL